MCDRYDFGKKGCVDQSDGLSGLPKTTEKLNVED